MDNSLKLRSVSKIFLFLLVVFALYAVIPQIYKSTIKIRKINSEISVLERKSDELNDEITDYEKRLQKSDNAFEKERIGRNRLQMIKKDEKIYRLIESPEED